MELGREARRCRGGYDERQRDRNGEFRNGLLTIHMSLGLSVMVLTIVRVAWRRVVPASALLPMSRLAGMAAKAAHLALYATMIAIPLIGLLAVWMKARDVPFFGLFMIPSPIGANKDLAKTLGSAHEIAAHMMLELAGLHAAAVLAHQFLLKDGTLSRMLPSSVLQAGSPPRHLVVSDRRA